MRSIHLFFWLIVMAAGTVAVGADDPQEATTADIRALQREVDRLDSSLIDLDDETREPRSFAGAKTTSVID